MSDNRGNSKILIIGILSIVVGIIALAFILKNVIFADDSKEPSSMLTEVQGSEGNKNDKNNNGITDEMQKTLDSEAFYEGITIEGVDISGKSKDEVKELFADKSGTDDKKDINISFKIDDETVALNGNDVQFDNNLDEIIDEAYNIGRESDKAGDDGLKERYSEIEELLKNPKDFKIDEKVSKESISKAVHNALDKYVKEPVNAEVTGFDTETLTFIVTESETGLKVNVDKVVDELTKAFETGDFSKEITVETEVIEPEVSKEFLDGYLCKVSSTTSTTTSSSNRNNNIDLVCKKIDGLVLMPGESFDFNTFIGKRTAEAGFKEAGGIFDGKLIQELGGGICQANAMIYHSVTKADLKVDTRTCHTWPSDYVPTGTDATVSWGGPEFKFTNSSDYPIALHAYYGNQKVTVEVFGRPLPDGQTIKLIGEVTSNVSSDKVEYVADNTLAVGKTVTERSAHNAIKAVSYKVYYDAEGNEIKREQYFSSSYPMINKKVKVGTLAEDGVTVFKLDNTTGEVTAPEGYVAPTPTPDPDAEITDTPEPTKKPKKPKKDTTETETGDTENDGESGSNGRSDSENEEGKKNTIIINGKEVDLTTLTPIPTIVPAG
ncbi:MAG: VanW family protein [Lachnospiraceae bacterium]|nr:VanW family protein [Lachnospiraceae bacterium]